MSQRALILATVQVLRAALNVDATQCDETHQGRPKPASVGRPFFVGVWDGEFRGGQTDEVMDAYYGITLTLSRPRGATPWDRIGPDFMSVATTGFADQVHKLAVLVHNSYPIMNAANQLIQAAPGGPVPVWGFSEPLRFVDGGRRLEKPHSWFHSTPRAAAGRRASKLAGFAQVLTFGRARRTQNTLDPAGWS